MKMISWEIIEKDVMDEIISTTTKLRNPLMLERRRPCTHWRCSRERRPVPFR